MKHGVLVLLVGVVFTVQLLSATNTSCDDSWFFHRCSLLNWTSMCTNDLNLTLNYSHLYNGDRSTITASYDDGGNDTYTYLICLRRYIPELNNVFYTNIACVETVYHEVDVSWRWDFHSNATMFVNVYIYGGVDYYSIACAMRNITVGRRLPLNISVSITEKGHDEQYSQLIPGNISIIVSAHLPNSSSNTSTVMYSYSLLLLDLKTENFTHQRYEVSNDSSLEFVFEFTDPGGYIYDVSMTANDSTNGILYSSESYIGELNIVEPVSYPAITVNRNQTASQGSSVDVVIVVDNGGSLPITVCWNLTVPPSEIPLNNHSDPNSHNKPSQPILTPYHYRCNSTINCTTFNLNSNYQFIFNCTFNSTGNYQLMALFNDSASAVPTPPVVATSAVVAISVIGVVVLLAIALYVPYYRCRNRFTEKANFRRPSYGSTSRVKLTS